MFPRVVVTVLRVPPPRTDRQRLAETLKARRAELRLTQTDVAHAAQVSLATINLMEREGRNNYQTVTKAVVEQAVGWAPGSIDALLNGGDATPLEPPPPARPELTLHQGGPSALPADLAEAIGAMPAEIRDLWERLARRIAEELVAGQQSDRAGSSSVPFATDSGMAYGVSLSGADDTDAQVERAADHLRDMLARRRQRSGQVNET